MHNALLATHWLSIVNSQAWTKKIRYNSIEQTIQVKNLLRHVLEYHKVVVSSTNEELGLSNTKSLLIANMNLWFHVGFLFST